MDTIKRIIKAHGAADVGVIRFKDCQITNPKLAERLGFEPESVFIGTVPYYTHFCDSERSVSAYALARDYHLHLKKIYDDSITHLKDLYPNASFAGFADHSPINEKQAAAKAGLGIIGQHSLLITENHSSFVFLFEIFTDLRFDADARNITFCEDCGKCRQACPVGLENFEKCLSAVTQKKGELTEEERRLIRESGCAWGCDICQLACPHTVEAIRSGTIYTDSSWFNSCIVAEPTTQSVECSEDFVLRAYSWRGPKTILRNIEIINTPAR